MQLIELDSILFLRAESNYSRIHLNNGTSIFCARVLKSLEADLVKKGHFLRVHQSYLVHTAAITTYFHDGYLKVNGSDERIPVARSKKPMVSAFFNRYRPDNKQ
jgi:two-component system LytT family response regulator